MNYQGNTADIVLTRVYLSKLDSSRQSGITILSTYASSGYLKYNYFITNYFHFFLPIQKIAPSLGQISWYFFAVATRHSLLRSNF